MYAPWVGSAAGGWTRRLLRRHAVSRTEQLLWVVVALSLLADVGLTWYALSIPLYERNPLAWHAYQAMGVAGLLGLKLFAVGVALSCRRATPVGYTAVVPAALAFPWVVASTMNTIVLFYHF